MNKGWNQNIDSDRGAESPSLASGREAQIAFLCVEIFVMQCGVARVSGSPVLIRDKRTRLVVFDSTVDIDDALQQNACLTPFLAGRNAAKKSAFVDQTIPIRRNNNPIPP